MRAVWYYPHGDRGPVKDFLEALEPMRPQALARLTADLDILVHEGLRSSRLVARPLGAGLWELKRRCQGIDYRLFLGVWSDTIWVLHAIEKKSAKTLRADLRLARARLREVSDT